jgi:hypothetical protein
MSTLNVSNITDGTDTVETGYVLNGSAKYWVNFNGTGTPSVRNSLNHSSITDNSTGDFTLTYTSSFSANDYAPTLLTDDRVHVGGMVSTAAANGRIQINDSRDAAYADDEQVTVTIQGDLA